VKSLKELASSVFDVEEAGMTLRASLGRSVFWVAVVFFLAFVLRPDLYGLVPNVLDPVFYTGYGINLDDVISAGGGGLYFVSRWPAYLPTHGLVELFGPYWGRLILRLVIVVLLAEAFWRIFQRLGFSAPTRILSTVLLLTTPMFVRAFTTDYPEYFIISAGLIALSLSFNSSVPKTRSLAIGTLAMSMVISNPTSVVLSTLILLNYYYQLHLELSLRKRFLNVMLLVISMLVTTSFGYFYFKIFYNLENIYSPTIKYLKTYAPSMDDPWRVDGRPWLLYFGWIYLPVVYLAVALQRLKTAESIYKNYLKRCILITIAIYAFHWLLELKIGHALETSYYWSLSLPPLLFLMILVLGKAFNFVDRRKSFLVLALVLVLYRLQIPQHFPLPNGMVLLLLVLSVILILMILNRKLFLLGTFLLVTTIWIQIGSPKYEKLTPGGNLNSPRYDSIFGQSSIASQNVLDEIIWFTEQMDFVSDDVRSVFAPTDGWSYVITGTYLPHPFGRFLLIDPDQQKFPEERVAEFQMGFSPVVVIYGEPSDCVKILKTINLAVPQLSIVRDVVHQGGHGYRLIALSSLAKKLD
jgi:hypothetical protein